MGLFVFGGFVVVVVVCFVVFFLLFFCCCCFGCFFWGGEVIVFCFVVVDCSLIFDLSCKHIQSRPVMTNHQEQSKVIRYIRNSFKSVEPVITNFSPATSL